VAKIILGNNCIVISIKNVNIIKLCLNVFTVLGLFLQIDYAQNTGVIQDTLDGIYYIIICFIDKLIALFYFQYRFIATPLVKKPFSKINKTLQ